MKILIAEDDPRLLKSLIHIFESNNFSVDGVSNGEDALDFGLSGEYDGFIFDIMMPGKDGLVVLKTLRDKGISTPALFLTARTEVEQRVEGLDAGADDYLPKPFATAELIARVRAMLRRKDVFTPDLLERDGLTLNKSTYQLSCGGKNVTLSGKEFQLLEMLMQRPGLIVTTDQFMTHVWGWESDVVHISNLRKKLDSLDAPLQIRFQRGAGYVLEERK